MDNKEYEHLKKEMKKEGFNIIGKKEFDNETFLYLKVIDKKMNGENE